MTRMDRRDFLRLGMSAGVALAAGGISQSVRAAEEPATTILTGGRIATMDPVQPFAEAIALRNERVLHAGSAKNVMAHKGGTTRVIDLRGRIAIPGLNDSHLHVIRGG